MASGTAEAHEKNLVGKLFFNEPVNGFKIYAREKMCSDLLSTFAVQKTLQSLFLQCSSCFVPEVFPFFQENDTPIQMQVPPTLIIRRCCF